MKGWIMNRRHVMSRLVAGAAGTALLAGTLASSQALAQDPMPMGEAEKKHAMDTKMVGGLSLATSRVALEKASDAIAKEFAKWEVAEQETIADILKTMESGSMKAEGALHPPSEAEVEAMLDAEGKQKLADLKGMSGAGFDKAYVSAQLDGHKKLLAIQEDYLKVGQNREHLSVAKLARGQVSEHIDHLTMMQSKMG